MENFEDAQRLFSDYEKNGGFHNLRNSLDILDEIIGNQSVDSQRALNFKNTISKHINKEIKAVFVKCNIPDFAKDLKSIDDQDLLLEKLAAFLSNVLTKKYGEILIELWKIQSEYFKAEAS